MSHFKPLRDTQPPDWNIIPQEPIEGPGDRENTVKTGSNGGIMGDCLPELARCILVYNITQDWLRVKGVLSLSIVDCHVLFSVMANWSRSASESVCNDIAISYMGNGNARMRVMRGLRMFRDKGMMLERIEGKRSYWRPSGKGIELFIAAMNEK